MNIFKDKLKKLKICTQNPRWRVRFTSRPRSDGDFFLVNRVPTTKVSKLSDLIQQKAFFEA